MIAVFMAQRQNPCDIHRLELVTDAVGTNPNAICIVEQKQTYSACLLRVQELIYHKLSCLLRVRSKTLRAAVLLLACEVYMPLGTSCCFD